MVAITKSIAVFDEPLRRELESALGVPLRADQRVKIQLLDSPTTPLPAGGSPSELPVWCHVYEGLLEDQVAKLESIVLQRADLGRTIE